MRGRQWERHVVFERLAASLPNVGPCPLDTPLIDLRRVGAIGLLGITQRSLRRLDQIVAFHMTKRRSYSRPVARTSIGVVRTVR